MAQNDSPFCDRLIPQPLWQNFGQISDLGPNSSFFCRQADPAAIVEIVQQSIQRIGDSTEDMHCILEEPVPNPANGRQSVFGTGYAFGVWSGVLSTSGISLETVTARRWKGDLGLNKCGKDGSRILAAALFPKAVSLLRWGAFIPIFASGKLPDSTFMCCSQKAAQTLCSACQLPNLPQFIQSCHQMDGNLGRESWDVVGWHQ